MNNTSSKSGDMMISSQTVRLKIWQAIQQHGLPVILLLLAIVWMHQRLIEVEQKAETCNAEVIQMLKEDRSKAIENQNQMVNALNRNSDVLELFIKQNSDH